MDDSPEPATSRVRQAWRVEQPGAIARDRWLAVAGAVAAWPGPPVVIERCWSTSRDEPLVTEHVVVSVDGANVLGDATAMAAEAAHLARMVLAGVVHERAGLRDVAAIADVAELRDVPCRLPWPAAPQSAAAALAALASDCGAATMSVVVASPALQTAPPSPDHQGPQVRLRLRLTADRIIPVAALAHAGALAGAAPGAWVRPLGGAELGAARGAVLAGAAHLWGRRSDAHVPDPGADVFVAADLLGTSLS